MRNPFKKKGEPMTAKNKYPDTVYQGAYEPLPPPPPLSVLEVKQKELEKKIAQYVALGDECTKLQLDISWLKMNPKGVEIMTRILEEWKAKGVGQ